MHLMQTLLVELQLSHSGVKYVHFLSQLLSYGVFTLVNTERKRSEKNTKAVNGVHGLGDEWMQEQFPL